MDKEKITYIHWKTGKKKEYLLNNYTYNIEEKTKFTCPFDNTHLVVSRGHENDKTIFCPNCHGEYDCYNYLNRTQESTNQEAVENVQQYKKDLIQNKEQQIKLKKKQKDLESRIKHAEKMRLSINN